VVVVALVIVLPAIALAEKARRGTGRRVACRAIRIVASLVGVRVEIRTPTQRPPGPVVFVPVHRSPIDIAVMMLADPEVRFLAASELFRIPLLAASMRALRCIPIDRTSPRQSITQIRELATSEDDRSLVVFAEGGIGEGPLGKFRSGAFVIATARGIPVVPVAIWGAADVLPSHGRLSVRPGLVLVQLAEAIHAEPPHDHRMLRRRTHDTLAALLDEPVARCIGTAHAARPRPDASVSL